MKIEGSNPKRMNVKRNLKFKHTTCTESLKEEKKEAIKNFIRSPFVIHVIILIFIYSLALVSFYKSSFFNFGTFCFWMGLGSWTFYYTNSQEIINGNQFIPFIILGLVVVIFSVFLLIITKSSFFDFIITGFPLFYIIYFRLLLFLFFRDFAKSFTKPTILFASKGGNWKHENPISGYIATKKEVVFSNLLFFGPCAFALIIFYFISLL
jgi:hypothetical protein